MKYLKNELSEYFRGEILKAQKESGGMNSGAKMNGKDEDGNFRRSHHETAEAPKLSDMGITKSMSSRAQAISGS